MSRQNPLMRVILSAAKNLCLFAWSSDIGRDVSLNMTARFMSHSIPDLNINKFLCFQRLTGGNAQQAICLTQTKQRMRFLTTGGHEVSMFQSTANVMRPIAIVC